MRRRCAEKLPYCLQLPEMPSKCLDLHEGDPGMNGHDYQDILDNPVSDSVRQQCVKLVSKFRRQLNCHRDVYDNVTLRRPAAMDACGCYPPCSDMTYDSSYSLSTLPPVTREHMAFYSHYDFFLQNRLSPERKRLLGVSPVEEFSKRSKRTVLSLT